jgi:XTP/dITP diphosphohydrolase
MKKPKLLIATHNKGKLERFKNYFTDLEYEILSLEDLAITYDVEETGTTYEENVTKKAQTYAKMAGLLTLADDGGLEVDALGGQPGVYSSRYAGENKTDAQKVAFLLDKLINIPLEKRQAKFVVFLALAHPDGKIELFKGQLEGHITQQPRGVPRKQLPYRQIFVPEGYNYTLDELDDYGISYISHRQKAVEDVKKYLKGI